MKIYQSQIERLEERAVPAVLLSPVNPALEFSPVMEFSESPTVLPALSPNLAPIGQATLGELLMPPSGVLPPGESGSVIPPLATPGAMLSGLSAPGTVQMFGTLR